MGSRPLTTCPGSGKPAQWQDAAYGGPKVPHCAECGTRVTVSSKNQLARRHNGPEPLRYYRRRTTRGVRW